MNIRILFALILCSLAFAASAQTTMGLHTVSIHAPDNGKVNNVNPGGFVSFDNCATVGFYRNSLRRMSVYAGCTMERGLMGVTIGAVTGYDKEHGGHSNAPVAPLLALHLRSPAAVLGATPGLTYILGHLVKSADVFHFFLRWSR